MAGERHNVAFLVGVMFGAAGAAVAALLSTPLSGAETRQQLSERVAALRGGTSTPTLSGGTVTPAQGTGTGTPTQSTDALQTGRLYSTDASVDGATTVAPGHVYSTAAPEPAQPQGGDTTTTTSASGSARDNASESTGTFGA